MSGVEFKSRELPPSLTMCCVIVGTIGGKKYGVAKEATIVDVLNCQTNASAITTKTRNQLDLPEESRGGMEGSIESNQAWDMGEGRDSYFMGMDGWI